MKPNVISFSGGQSSGYMFRRLLDEANKQYEAIFCNTGKEHDETLNFVHEVEKRWHPVTWLEYCRKDNEHSFRVVDYDSAARRTDSNTPFDEMLGWLGTLPNVRVRACSGQLKVRTIRRYLQARGETEWTSAIGIRADEAHRCLDVLSACPKYITPRFPLCEAKVNVKEVNAFWNSQPFKLEIPNYMGNCDLCFLKAKWKRIAIMRSDPAAAQWWINWEKKKALTTTAGDGASWQKGVSYESLLSMAQHPELDLDYGEEDVACSCASGGYRDEALPVSSSELESVAAEFQEKEQSFP